MINTARQLKDLICNLLKEKSGDAITLRKIADRSFLLILTSLLPRMVRMSRIWVE